LERFLTSSQTKPAVWPIFACHAPIFTADSASASGVMPDSFSLGGCCRRNCLQHKKALAYIRQGLSTIRPSNINTIREGLDQNDGLF